LLAAGSGAVWPRLVRARGASTGPGEEDTALGWCRGTWKPVSAFGEILGWGGCEDSLSEAFRAGEKVAGLVDASGSTRPLSMRTAEGIADGSDFTRAPHEEQNLLDSFSVAPHEVQEAIGPASSHNLLSGP
jgi:hypothetical protein